MKKKILFKSQLMCGRACAFYGPVPLIPIIENSNLTQISLKSQLICRRTRTLYEPVPLIPIIKNLQADSSSKEWSREALNISKWLKCISKYFNIQLHVDLHTFKPALTKKSTRTDFIFVCPDLKSSPPIKVPCFLASSTTPGTFVF